MRAPQCAYGDDDVNDAKALRARKGSMPESLSTNFVSLREKPDQRRLGLNESKSVPRVSDVSIRGSPPSPIIFSQLGAGR